jgi:hypothetical protein
MYGAGEGCEENATGRSNCATERVVPQKYYCALGPRLHGGWDIYGIHHGGCTITKRVPLPFGFAKHVVCIGIMELCVETEVGTHVLCV